MNRIEFHIFKSSYDHEKKAVIVRIIREIRIQIFCGICGHLPRIWKYVGEDEEEKKSTKKYTDTACVRSNDSGTVYQINSLVSGFNLWSSRHTVALVLILIEDITFHYQV